MDKNLYDGRGKLVCSEFPDRCLGVIVSNPFKTNDGDKLLCDIEGEQIAVNTKSFGNTIDYDEWEAKAKRYTKNIIRNIDVIVMELKIHRKRLEMDLMKIDNYKTDKQPKGLIY